MIRSLSAAIVSFLIASAALATDPVPAPPAPGTEAATPTVTAEASRLSEDLVYSVDRTPERIFDTARAVQVITEDQIRRSNAQTLEQLLAEEAGFSMANQSNGTMPIVRGLGGKQVMFLIDGVRVNNGSWRGPTREYLGVFGLTQIERIEIVRGVVSVLGTESLGGVVNIITKKASARDSSFGGTLSGMYASASGMGSGSLSTFGTLGPVRYTAGAYRTNSREIDGGGIGRQQGTSSRQQGAYVNGQWLLSREKTVSFGYQYGRAASDVPPAVAVVGGTNDPTELRLGSLSFQDLVSRSWEDSLKVSLYSNRQKDIHDVSVGVLVFHEFNDDNLNGLNVEFGKFIGTHHLVYGGDYTSEKLGSNLAYVFPDGRVSPQRGNMMDGAKYRTASIYLQDRFDAGKWLTVIAGMRGSRFDATGQETRSGKLSVLDTQRANGTGALNLIGHLTPRLNVIANAVRGYRAPNLEELTWAAIRTGVTRLAALDARPEKVLSLESGLKYDGQRFSGSAFYFRNRFTDYLVEAPAYVNGLPFTDSNGNGIKDPREQALTRLQNVGKATIEGAEATFGLELPRSLHLSGNYSRVIGTDNITDGPLNLIPPANGLLSLRWLPAYARRPWVEVQGRFASAQHRIGAADRLNPYVGPNGVPAYRVFDVRGGLTVANRVGLTVGVENLTDEKYRFFGSDRYNAGRQLVVGTQVQF